MNGIFGNLNEITSQFASFSVIIINEKSNDFVLIGSRVSKATVMKVCMLASNWHIISFWLVAPFAAAQATNSMVVRGTSYFVDRPAFHVISITVVCTELCLHVSPCLLLGWTEYSRHRHWYGSHSLEPRLTQLQSCHQSQAEIGKTLSQSPLCIGADRASSLAWCHLSGTRLDINVLCHLQCLACLTFSLNPCSNCNWTHDLIRVESGSPVSYSTWLTAESTSAWMHDLILSWRSCVPAADASMAEGASNDKR